MLHSALPRAFLPPPGLCYFGGYYGETVHPYNPVSRFIALENAYASVHDQHQQSIINAKSTRPITPSPLDLSLKPSSSSLSSILPPPPPPISHTPDEDDECEAIEVDDVDERLSEEKYARERNFRHNNHEWETQFNVDDQSQRSPMAHPYHSYDDSHQDIQRSPGATNLYQSETASNYHSPSSSPVLNDTIIVTTPNGLRSMQTYQQQILLTPPHHLQGLHAPMTPPSTPSPPQCLRRRHRDDEESSINTINVTPVTTTPKTPSNIEKSNRSKKKHVRRLKFDEDTSSPVSGTVILGPDEAVVTGDIDPAFNIVEVTEEARAELAKIENRLGPYQCKLCRQLHDDAFQLAQHRCSRIAHVEYRCPECDKRFSCPANLASHRRWHKPRIPASEVATTSNTSAHGSVSAGVPSSSNADHSCTRCDAKFTRQAALRKHLATQHPESNNNVLIMKNNQNSNSSSSNNNFTIENANGNMITSKATINPMAIGSEAETIEMP